MKIVYLGEFGFDPVNADNKPLRRFVADLPSKPAPGNHSIPSTCFIAYVLKYAPSSIKLFSPPLVDEFF